MKRRIDPLELTIQAGFLAWLLPGLGHWRLGQRNFALIYFVAITLSYWTGIAVGGVKTSVDPVGNVWLFVAELGAGGYTGVCYMVSSQIPTVRPTEPSPYVSYYPESEVAQIYLAVAGLLNVLAVLDAMTRAQHSGLPVFYFEQGAPGRQPPTPAGGAQ